MAILGLITSSESYIAEIEVDFTSSSGAFILCVKQIADVKLIDVGLSIATPFNSSAVLKIWKGSAEMIPQDLILSGRKLPLMKQGNVIRHWVNSLFTAEAEEVVIAKISNATVGVGTIHLFIKKRR